MVARKHEELLDWREIIVRNKIDNNQGMTKCGDLQIKATTYRRNKKYFKYSF